jgi:hypothetical protein
MRSRCFVFSVQGSKEAGSKNPASLLLPPMFRSVPVHITFQTEIIKKLQNLTYNVVHVLSVYGRELALLSSSILLPDTKAYIWLKSKAE